MRRFCFRNKIIKDLEGYFFRFFSYLIGFEIFICLLNVMYICVKILGIRKLNESLKSIVIRI